MNKAVLVSAGVHLNAENLLLISKCPSRVTRGVSVVVFDRNYQYYSVAWPFADTRRARVVGGGFKCSQGSEAT